MWKRLKNSRHHILKQAGIWTGSVYAILGFLRMFVSLEGLFDSSASFWNKLLISFIILLGVWCLFLLISGGCVLLRKKVKVINGRNGRAVYVTYGDLFDKKLVPQSTEKRNICFAVNRCFDTIVDEHLISSQTIHGYALKRLYDQGIYTPQSLDQTIQKALPINPHYVTLSSNQKPKGNLKRYDVGTAVDIPVSHELNYFMIGVSSFNVDLKAETSRDEYVLAIQRMIDFYDAHSQGYPILMPIIGGFLSRTGQSEIDLLKFIIRTLKLNEDHINSDIYIVIREGAKNTISLFNLI